jgi:hypothetical protein
MVAARSRTSRKKGPTETALQTKAIELLRGDGFRVERINSGLARGLYGGVIHLAEKGTPDLLVEWPYLWIEMKCPGEKLNDDQEKWHAWARENGVPHTIAYSPEEALAAAVAERTRNAV